MSTHAAVAASSISFIHPPAVEWRSWNWTGPKMVTFPKAEARSVCDGDAAMASRTVIGDTVGAAVATWWYSIMQHIIYLAMLAILIHKTRILHVSRHALGTAAMELRRKLTKITNITGWPLRQENTLSVTFRYATEASTSAHPAVTEQSPPPFRVFEPATISGE